MATKKEFSEEFFQNLGKLKELYSKKGFENFKDYASYIYDFQIVPNGDKRYITEKLNAFERELTDIKEKIEYLGDRRAAMKWLEGTILDGYENTPNYDHNRSLYYYLDKFTKADERKKEIAKLTKRKENYEGLLNAIYSVFNCKNDDKNARFLNSAIQYFDRLVPEFQTYVLDNPNDEISKEFLANLHNDNKKAKGVIRSATYLVNNMDKILALQPGQMGE